ncbi:MAG: NADH-quinone oxidoreductase subunit J [Kofleriaceae bacterium]
MARQLTQLLRRGAAALVLGLLVALTRGGATPAAAQPARGELPAGLQTKRVVARDAAERPAPGADEHAVTSETKASKTTPHGERTEGNRRGLALLFWVFAAGCVGGALFVITRANLITAVMGMVGTFLAIAAVYMMLFATFLAVIQVLVYAGAIMVLFVFVIMILNRPEAEPFATTGRAGKGLAAAGMAYLLLRLVTMLWKVSPGPLAAKAPAAVDIGVANKLGQHVPELVDWGSTKAVGAELFTGYLFPFEAVSILLLIAVVGAIAVARPLDPQIENPGDEPEAGKA